MNRPRVPLVFRRSDTHHAVSVLRDRIARQVHEIVQERNRARATAVVLEQQTAALRDLIDELIRCSTDEYVVAHAARRLREIDEAAA